MPPSARVLSARKQSQMNGTLQREIDAGILRDACACQRSLRLVRYLHAYQKNKKTVLNRSSNTFFTQQRMR